MKYYFPKDKPLTTAIIEKLINLDRQENARKMKMKDYYMGRHNILRREFDDPSKPNNRVVNPYANYITTLMVGYFVGEPVEYTSEDEAALTKLKEIFEYNDEPAVNKELAKNAPSRATTCWCAAATPSYRPSVAMRWHSAPMKQIPRTTSHRQELSLPIFCP